MSEQSSMENFLASVGQRALPHNPMQRVRVLAKELAEGAAQGLWGVGIGTFRGMPNDTAVQQYIQARWGDALPNLGILVSYGYLSFNAHAGSSSQGELVIMKAAFDLIDEGEEANIFISYKRSESSAFALLVLARLKAAGMEPFLDLALQPGDDWERGLRERIQRYQYLIAILGPETLRSEVCLREISWAIEAGLQIIPIWHNGFTYVSGAWDVSLKVDTALSKTHTIRVIEESALGYNNALVELLNRFGVTP
ncbi:MAG: toll/interleukin-1 receptor domain-containing protein [Anaerolineae bacterium]|nr:toll/interleukin-1 receptor domain-containing protein [Anaerolineae bacterium]